MQGFSNPFTFTEEFYLFRGPSATSVDSFTRRDLHVLMNLDPATPTPARPVPQPPFPQLQATDLPLAWTRQHGAGRVFYSAFGHRPETWDNPQFRAHAAAAIRWALFDGDGDGLDDRWEAAYGLPFNDGTGANGANGDPDGDGRTNVQEQAADTHPRGFAQRYLAEGATSNFFETQHRRTQPQSDVHVPRPAPLSAGQRRGPDRPRRRWRRARAGRCQRPPARAFSTLIVSDRRSSSTAR